MTMLMDDRTKKLLGIDKVLSELHPITPFGIQCKNQLKPFLPKQKEALQEELDRIEKMKTLMEKQRPVFMDIKSHMRAVKDIRKSIERCMSGGVLNQVEFFELKNLITLLNAISAGQEQLHWNIPEKHRIEPLHWVNDILDPEHTGLKTFYIYDAYSQKLTHIREQKNHAEQHLDQLKKQHIKTIEEDLKIQLRASGELTVSKNQTDLIAAIKAHPHLQAVGETYVNMVFKLKPDETMLEHMKEIEFLKEEESLEEIHILETLSMKIASRGDEIVKAIEALGEFDLLMAKAVLAVTHNAIKPVLTETADYTVTKGRHPMVESNLKKQGKTYTPISIRLNQGVALITGANMGGKTVSLKLFGLLAGMVQYGLLVPAEYMETCLFDFLFISAGDEQSIDLGLSTFGAEMKGIRDILQKSHTQGMILIDELARGTNPQEGYAISAAIIQYLIQKPCLSVITTHFDGLVKRGVKHLQVNGLRAIDLHGIKNPDLIAEYMDYTLVEVQGDAEVPRDAINISRLMGIPEEILQEAELILNQNT